MPSSAVARKSSGSKTPALAKANASLADLTAIVKREHEACQAAVETTLDHAIRAGEVLSQIRDILKPRGEWQKWIEDEFPRDRSTAYTYLRVFQYRGKLPPRVGRITEADMLIRGLPDIDGGPPRKRVSDDRKDEARELRNQGHSYKEIAKALGVSVSTVYNWLNGHMSKYQQEAREALKKERLSKKQKTINKAVRKKGGALAEAYAMAERLQDVIAQAHTEAKEPQARRSLQRATEYHHAMRDFIVQALGVEP